MEDDTIELITEWPIKDVYHTDSTGEQSSHNSTCVSSTFSSSKARQRKRQYQLSSPNNIIDKTCLNQQKDSDAAYHSLPSAAQSERTQTHSESDSDQDKDVSRVPFKAPKMERMRWDSKVAFSLKEYRRHRQYICRTASDDYVSDTHASNNVTCGVNLVSAERCEYSSGTEQPTELCFTQSHPNIDRIVRPVENRSPGVQAQSRIARWWRRHGQHLVGFEQRGKTLGLPKTTNPNTLLFHVARLPEGQAFLRSEQQQLKRRVEKGERTADLLAALGSVAEWLGNPDEAVLCLTQALETEPDNKEWQWLLHKVRRQQRVKRRQAELMSTVPSQPVFPEAQQVERVSCNDLDFLDFFHKYAMGRRPVIITDMVETMTAVPWNLQHIREVAGDCQAKVKRSVPGSVEWAELEESKSVKVSQFLDSLHSCHDYLFDWSLPLHCPRLAEELTVPRYFAGDFLQRSSPGSLYQDSWPSLFIAPPGVHSSLHIDAFASNFWMALFQGRKRWVFFQAEDTPCLYPVYAHSLDPTFEVSVADPDLEAHPLLSLVHPTECVLNAGEILFVPGGCPHFVQNLDTTLAISANFVDLSNFHKVLEELGVNALLDPRADHLAQQFRQPSFLAAMKRNMGNLSWTEFKTWPPADVDMYSLTEDSITKER